MQEKHEYANYNGMTVPNGHMYDYIQYLLENNLYSKFDITYNDGDMDRALLIEKIDDCTYKFRRLHNNREFIIQIAQIHLLNKLI